jgi:hypothetical protein
MSLNFNVTEMCKLSLCLTEYHAMKTYPLPNKTPCLKGILAGGGILHAFSSLVPDGGERLASRPSRFSPNGRPHFIHWIGDWVGPRAGLDAVTEKRVPASAEN